MPDNKYLDEFPEPRGEGEFAELAPGKSAAYGKEGSQENRLFLIWEGLSRVGLGEAVFKFGTHTLTIALGLVVLWVMSVFYLNAREEAVSNPGVMTNVLAAASMPQSQLTQELPPLPPFLHNLSFFSDGIPRMVVLDTVIPARPRSDVITYTVEAGDTVFGIAEKHGLRPETILWSNYDILLDNPHRLMPGQELFILPINGIYHRWSNGEGLNGVTQYYGVTIDDVLNYPGNNLSAETIGDLANPNIEPGTRLIIPGGQREFITWSAFRISRTDPAVSRVLGPGGCGTISDGLVGTGSFLWPANDRTLSGFDYNPAANHRGIDIRGRMGDPIYASDAGVIVYSGWNNFGYGNVIVIDHGGGWQTLYAHLSVINFGCGESVFRGSIIGLFGSTGNSTGPHLHFEMLHERYGKVNPWDFLE
jgi:murein DD-endopeptidase MepM/ murein hydrolase activator NlpD